jgi:hypothetical protein
MYTQSGWWVDLYHFAMTPRPLIQRKSLPSFSLLKVSSIIDPKPQTLYMRIETYRVCVEGGL